jgi:hypothetical protein
LLGVRTLRLLTLCAERYRKNKNNIDLCEGIKLSTKKEAALKRAVI